MIAPTGTANGAGGVAGSNGDEPPKEGQDRKLSITGVQGAAENPETQGAAAPAQAELAAAGSRMAILHLAQNLSEPQPLPEQSHGRQVMSGAYYLAEQQANRLNHPEPKQLRDNIFCSPSAAISMDFVATELREGVIPERKPFKTICQTIVEAKNLSLQDVASQTGKTGEIGQATQATEATWGSYTRSIYRLVLGGRGVGGWAQYSRIYIPGHGMPGSGLLKQGGESFTAQQVAKRLADSGALAYVKDVRITSSGSSQRQWQGRLAAPVQPELCPRSGTGDVIGDSFDLSGTSASAIAAMGERVSAAVNLMGPDTRARAPEVQKNDGQAFAQALSSELAKLGHGNVVVSGYAGEEMPLFDAENDCHQRRTISFVDDQHSAVQRRSRVRTKYKNGVVFRNPAEQPPATPPAAQHGAEAAEPEQEDDE